MALRVLVVIALTLALLGGGETLATDASVSFTRDIAPVLIERCVRCHGDEAAKGDYRLDTFSHLNRPGDSGRVPISTLDPAKSPFLVLLTTDDPDDRMPQKGEPLDSSTVDRIRKWIEQGADFDGPDPEKPLAEFAFEPFAQAPAHYAYPVPVAAVVGIGKGSIAAGGFREITVWNAEGVLEKRIGGVPERILGLVRGPEEGTLLFAGGSPGRSGAAGMVDVRGDSGPRVFLRGSDTLLALAVTRDGSRIAVGGTERGIVVLDGGTFDRLRTLTSHSDWVLDLAFSSDGRYLATASRDRTARIFQVTDGTLVSVFRDHKEAVTAVAFVEGSSRVVSAGKDGRLRIWNPETGKDTKASEAIGAEVTRLVVDGNRIVSAWTDGRVREYQGDNLKRIRELGASGEGVLGLAVEGDTIVATHHGGTVRVWDSKTSGITREFPARP